jgi:ATPase subunit of ABC transporter with duplicated ATPase domains
MEKTEDGKRFKQSYRFGFHADSRVAIVVEQGVKTATIKIPEPSNLRYNGAVFRMSEASFRYPGAAKNSIESFSINIEPNARIAFIGPNGLVSHMRDLLESLFNFSLLLGVVKVPC